MKESIMKKMGGRYKTTPQPRWVRLTEQKLQYFLKDPKKAARGDSVNMKGSIHLNDVSGVWLDNRAEKKGRARACTDPSRTVAVAQCCRSVIGALVARPMVVTLFTDDCQL